MSASKPATRQEFIDFCLRRLGAPVVEINVDDLQLEDCVEEAFEYYHDFHYDAVEKIYLKHQVTSDDIEEGYIEIPEAVIGIYNIFPINQTASNSDNLFNAVYQLRLNDIYDLTSTSILYFTQTMQYLQLIDTIINGQKPIRFNRHTNRLYIDMDWSNSIEPGRFIIVEAYRYLDPSVMTDVFNDYWLKKYATALMKKQWATNLKKFSGIQLPGGVTLDGDKLYQEATDEISQLEKEAQDTWSLPPDFMMG